MHGHEVFGGVQQQANRGRSSRYYPVVRKNGVRSDDRKRLLPLLALTWVASAQQTQAPKISHAQIIISCSTVTKKAPVAANSRFPGEISPACGVSGRSGRGGADGRTIEQTLI